MTVSSILIQQGRVINPSTHTDAVMDVAIANGVVVGLGATIPADFQPQQRIDATGLIVCPGLVDLSARLREPGFEYKATLESEMQAALAGGVTSLACPPDTDPVLDEPGLVEMLKHRARQLSQAHVYPIGALTQKLEGKIITEMAELAEAGCVAFSQADTPIIDTQVLYRALMYAHSFNFPVWLRPEDAYLARLGVAHDGAIATRLGLNGIPVMAEVIALHTLIELVKQTQAHVHVCRISSAEGIALIRAAKVAGLPITCDVGIHHVHLTDMDIGFFNPQARFAPPLRSQRDQAAIHYGLRDGTIDAICSDHTPHDEDEKLLPFAEADPGATGLELLLPLTLKWANEQQVDIAAALAKITSQPAQLMRIAAGDLSVGAMADVCIFDPSHEWILTPQQLKSQGKNSPYLEYPLLGRVTHTLVAGELVFALS